MIDQNRSNGYTINQHLELQTEPSKISPNWDFWFENVASGNPDFTCIFSSSNSYSQIIASIIDVKPN
jgi:hypothetical protein